jgi:hypothetical protein
MSTIVTRAGKGSPLTHVEVDANFTNLDTDKVEKTAAAISGGTINGTTIGATTPSSVNATTITGQTARVNGTGTNLATFSSVLTNANWTPTGLTVTGSQTDPFSGTTAALLNNGTSTGLHYLLCGNSVSGLQTISVYAKAGTANFVGLYNATSTTGVFFNLTTGAFSANINAAPSAFSSTDAGSGWWRISITVTASAGFFWILMSENGTSFSYTGTSKTAFIAAPQIEVSNSPTTYIPTTTTAVYGTPTLSFSGVAGLGLESNGALYVSPAGTGALQAQATTSSTVGGNARGANAVDWQTSRGAANQVASGQVSFVGGGFGNKATGYASIVTGGYGNTESNQGFVGGGSTNTQGGIYGAIVGGSQNTLGSNAYSSIIGAGYQNNAQGYFSSVLGGTINSTTSGSAVTTQSSTMNGTTAVTLSGSNGSIKVGQLVTGTYIPFPNCYVAAISGTSLTLSTAASGSGTATLSFYTPHGVVVGGGNNQATGSYSFIGGGGDAGTAANRNVASGDWSVVAGGRGNTASGIGAFVGGGGLEGTSSALGNTASGLVSFIGGGLVNQATSNGASILGGYQNTANGQKSTVVGGSLGTTRGITANIVFSASNQSISGNTGVTQAGLLILGRQTTDATATALTSDPNAAGTTNQVILPNNSAYFFTGEVISGVTGGGDTKGWTIEGVIKRGANAASTALVGTPTVTSMYADVGAATWAIAVTADTTNGGIRVTFTGQAATTIRTVCQIRTTEMTF